MPSPIPASPIDKTGSVRFPTGIFEWPWQKQLAHAVRKIGDLFKLLGLDTSAYLEVASFKSEFPLLVPHSFVARMRYKDRDDPLLKQVLPIEEELLSAEGFSADPVEDNDATIVPGLLQKYNGRALMITTGACAVHCRYCFRRHFPYEAAPKSLEQWGAALAWIEQNSTIDEVLLSGGDPLTLSDDRFGEFLERLEAIPHLRRLRIHTRLPIVLPARVTAGLCELLTKSRLTPVVVVHANHANELHGDCADALLRLRSIPRVLVFNQAVLLAGINDSLDALAQLSLRLIELGVVPYYLNQLDRVAGASHFEVPTSRGLELIKQLTEQLPGYAVPKYVWDQPGNRSKQTVSQ